MQYARTIVAVGLIGLVMGCVRRAVPVDRGNVVTTRAVADQRGEVEWITFTKITFQMVRLDGGEVLLGSPAGEAMRSESEGPAVVVKVRPFRMGRTEVTWELFKLWRAGELASREYPGRDPREKEAMALRRPTSPYYDPYSEHGHDDPQRPVGFITPYCAQEFCKWLSVRTGRLYRLPTEAEWVYAARAGSNEAFSWREGKAEEYAWFGNERVGSRSHRVGEKQANAWGLYDMAGNVAEWVVDGWSDDLSWAAKGDRVNPWFKPGQFGVAKGGAWSSNRADLRPAARLRVDASGDDHHFHDVWWRTSKGLPEIGFRVVSPVEWTGEDDRIANAIAP